MRCPDCTQELVPPAPAGEGDEREPGVRCPGCGGRWLDEASFLAAQDRADPEHDWHHTDLWSRRDGFAFAPSRRACPSCGETMLLLRYGDTAVEVDHCEPCHGLWLDGQELERIVAALARTATPARHLLHALRLFELRVLTDHPALRQALLQLQRGTALG